MTVKLTPSNILISKKNVTKMCAKLSKFVFMMAYPTAFSIIAKIQLILEVVSISSFILPVLLVVGPCAS